MKKPLCELLHSLIIYFFMETHHLKNPSVDWKPFSAALGVALEVFFKPYMHGMESMTCILALPKGAFFTLESLWCKKEDKSESKLVCVPLAQNRRLFFLQFLLN